MTIRRPLVRAATAAVLLGSAAAGVAVPGQAGAHPVARSAAHRPTAAQPSWFARHGTHPARLATPSRRAAAARAEQAGPRSVRLTPAAAAQPAARGRVRVTVGGDPGAVAARVRALGGRVLATAGDASVAVVGRARLDALAASRGVTRVDTVRHPYATSVDPGPSQAVAASGADAWHAAGQTGAGVKLAVIDLGFGTAQEYSSELDAGHLGAGTQLENEDCTDSDLDPTPWTGDSHGLAVAEVAQQQAPGAQLYLYCVASPEGLSQAVLSLTAAGVPIASSSLGWYLDSRGDGTGVAGSVASSVRYARQHGVLWVNSAGNEVPQHYSGRLADSHGDHYLDMGGTSLDDYPYESNFYFTAPGSAAAPTGLDFFFQWDEWPAAAHRLTLEAYGVQCTADFGSGGFDDCQGQTLPTRTATNATGGQPGLEIDTTNDTGFVQIWELDVHFPGTFTAGLRYDLFAAGDSYYDSSDLSCATYDDAGFCTQFSAPAQNGSLLVPANSPYALSVGAVDAGSGFGGDDGATGSLEPYSSQGPTISGRVAPDLAGWDGLSSDVSDFASGFYGTSAAAPSVAGAAALVEGANPALDAAQVQAFLEQRAQGGAPANPPTDQTGHGTLTLGDPPPAGSGADYGVPPGARYVAVAPKRIVDTRTGTGGHRGALGAGGTLTVDVAVPDGTTAVAINLTGTAASGSTYLTAYPGGTAFPGTSNVNLSRSDPASAAFAVVAVHDGAITVRNASGTAHVVVDEVGYFTTAGGAGYTSLSTAKRVLDTRKGARIVSGHHVTVHPGVPSSATAVVVDLAVPSPAASGYLTASPGCTTTTSSLNYTRGYTRANLAVVSLGPAHTFCLGVHGGGSANAVVDVVGYLGAGGSGYVALPTGTRIVDTRTALGGNGGGHAHTPLAAAHSAVYYAANVGPVPAAATALFGGLAEARSTGNGWLQVFPGTTRPAAASSNLNFTKGRVVPNGAVIPLSTGHQFGVYNSAGTTDVLVDLFGYFVRPAGSIG